MEFEKERMNYLRGVMFFISSNITVDSCARLNVSRSRLDELKVETYALSIRCNPEIIVGPVLPAPI